jgi:uridine kinase
MLRLVELTKATAVESWFLAGLVTRVLLIVVLVPEVQRDWFVPFLSRAASPGDPYAAWLSDGGSVLAWPYGLVMIAAHLPTVLGGALGVPLPGGSALFGTSILLADFTILLALRCLGGESEPMAAKLWWWSPAALVISYYHGQTDAIPVGILMAGLVGLSARRWRLAGLLIGASVAAKLTMLVAVPFLLIFLLSSRRYRSRAGEVIVPMLGVPLAAYAVLALSPAAREMIFLSPIIGKASALTFSVDGTPVMLLPAALVGLLYVPARSRRLGLGLLSALLGCALFVMALLVAAPGWWLCALPFLSLYAAHSTRPATTAVALFFSCVLAVHVLVHSSGAMLIDGTTLALPVTALVDSVSLTLVFAVGLVLATSMFLRALKDNDPFQLARRPIVIGIAGDSGVGKDTLAGSLARLLGQESSVLVSGDDYHRWERGSHMWGRHTHLSPVSARLDDLVDDVRRLVAGRSIRCRVYDHESGRFIPGSSKRHNDVIIVSGLQVLQAPELRKLFDVRIFLDMHEPLRKYFKVRRDTNERGHTIEAVLAALEKRGDDRRTYVLPQADDADLVFRLQPDNPHSIPELGASGDVRLNLEATMRDGIRSNALSRLLTSLSGTSPDVEPPDSRGAVRMGFTGDEISAQDVEAVIRVLIPGYREIVGLEPAFAGGVTGVMNLLVLMQLQYVRLAEA